MVRHRCPDLTTQTCGPASWENMLFSSLLPRMEHHHQGDKNAHVKDVHVHQNLKAKTGEEKKCCANWVDPEKVEYCWVTTSCLEWGQNSADRDYSTVEDQFCKAASDCA